MLCAASVDRGVYEDWSSIEGALRRAASEGSVVQLYAHAPGRLSDPARLEAIAATAASLGLRSFTYGELGTGPAAAPGLALSIDDDDVPSWVDTATMLERYGARATFFVTRYHLMSADDRAALADLAQRGHGVEAHGVNHRRGPDMVDDHGLATYLRDEVVPSLDGLRADGLTPTVFAYPYGARTPELDRAVLEHVAVVRSVSFSTDNFLVVDPCPE